MKVHLLLVAAMMCLLQTPKALMQDSEFSYSTNASLGWLQEISSSSLQPLSRRRRTLALPFGSNFEIKWSVNFPFETFTLYKARVQFAIPIKFGIPQDIAIADPVRRTPDADYEALEFVDLPDGTTGPYAHWYQPAHSNLPQYNNQHQQNNQYNNQPQYSHQPEQWHRISRRAARRERLYLYNSLESIFNKARVDGRSCLLRTICEVAEAPFDQGIVGEMINDLLTASLAGRGDTQEEKKEFDHFIEAELHGKLNGDCEKRYHQCQVSLFDLLPLAVQNAI